MLSHVNRVTILVTFGARISDFHLVVFNAAVLSQERLSLKEVAEFLAQKQYLISTHSAGFPAEGATSNPITPLVAYPLHFAPGKLLETQATDGRRKRQIS